jgi:membrane protein implicated in regulation of membrane protease activity
MDRVLVWLGLGLVLMGLLIAALGVFLRALGPRGFRLLPGDIVISRPGFTLVFPIVTSLVVSLVLTLLLWAIAGLRR